nr:MFS transporter [Streptomyces sp. I6]
MRNTDHGADLAGCRNRPGGARGALSSAGLFPGPRRARALGVLGAGAALGGGTGMLLGGVLTDAVGWRGVFFATALLALLLALACVPGVPADSGYDRRPARRVPRALALMPVGILALAYGVTEAGRSGWTRPAVLVPLGAGAALLAVFAAAQKQGDRPLLPLRLLTRGVAGPAYLGMAVLGTVVAGTFFFLSLYQQQVLGDGPRTAALYQVPLSVAAVLGSTLAPRIARRAGPGTVLGSGLAALAAGLLWLGRAPGKGAFVQEAMAPSLLVGAGLGVAFVQLTQAATADVPYQDAGRASGLLSTAKAMGGVFGLALLTGLAVARTGADPLASGAQALHEGYQAAFTTLGLVALTTALVLLTVFAARGRRAPRGAAKGPGERPGPFTAPPMIRRSTQQEGVSRADHIQGVPLLREPSARPAAGGPSVCPAAWTQLRDRDRTVGGSRRADGGRIRARLP